MNPAIRVSQDVKLKIDLVEHRSRPDVGETTSPSMQANSLLVELEIRTGESANRIDPS